MEKKGFILYNSFYEPIKALKNEQLGKLLRAIFNYTINSEITQDSDILVAFMFIKNQIDIDTNKWEEERQKRKEAGRLGGIQRAINNKLNLSSNAKQSLDVLSNAKQSLANQADKVEVEVKDKVNIKEKINKKEKYGVYGRVKLTIDEYLKLVNEFGEDFIKKQIDLLDEYVEGNNNKNHYTNFNLVLRKSIRENWFKQKKEGSSNNVFLDIMKDDYGR
jgi:hypothetical protein